MATAVQVGFSTWTCRLACKSAPLPGNSWELTPNTVDIPLMINMGTNSATLYGVDGSFRTSTTFRITIPGGPPIAAAMNGSNIQDRGNNFLLTSGTATGCTDSLSSR